MSSTVYVKPELISWAIERSGLTVDKLDKFPDKLRNGNVAKSNPHSHQLKEFAKRTMTPLGYLVFVRAA